MSRYGWTVADPITDLFNFLLANPLCLLSALAFVAFLFILFVVLYIRRVRSTENWAYNPDKHLHLKWRRG